MQSSIRQGLEKFTFFTFKNITFLAAVQFQIIFLPTYSLHTFCGELVKEDALYIYLYI